MTSFKARFSLLLVSFFSLVIISAAGTFWGLSAQANDALVINLAGRQRMLLQQMMREAYAIQNGDEKQAALARTASTFEETLQALQHGGPAVLFPQETVLVPYTKDKPILQQLERVGELWDKTRFHLDTLLTSPPHSPQFSSALAIYEKMTPSLVSEADAAVRLYQSRSTRIAANLRWLQIGFLSGALGMLVLGAWKTHHSVLVPLDKLGNSVRRISSGDLSTPVETAGLDEFRNLAYTFELMRAELEASQKKLVEWTATLEKRVEERTQEVNALYQVSQEITSRLDLNLVLRSVTDHARNLLKADVAVLCMVEPEQRSLNLQAYTGPVKSIVSSAAPPGNPLVAEVLSSRAALPCGGNGCSRSCGILSDTYRKSHLASPLWLGNHLIGALCIGSQADEAFQNESGSLLTRLSGAAAIAIENARLYSQAERLAALEERQRIAASMHDGLAQTISYLGLILDQVYEYLDSQQIDEIYNHLYQLGNGIDQANKDVRRSIASLQDELPPAKDLQAQMRDLVQEMREKSDPELVWTLDLPGSTCVSPHNNQLVLSIAREALINIQRHAHASEVKIALSFETETAQLCIQDDGQGFNPQMPASDGKPHFGLNILRARAAHLGGTVTIDSEPGRGTRIQVSWPLQVDFPAEWSVYEPNPAASGR